MRERARGRTRPARGYESLRFDRDGDSQRLKASAGELVQPGHPLLDALVDHVLETTIGDRREGCLLVDGRQGGEVRLLVALVQSVVDAHDPPLPVARRFEVIELFKDGAVVDVGPQALQAYRPATEAEMDVATPLLEAPWLALGVEEVARAWAITDALPAFEEEIARSTRRRVNRTRTAVLDRLTEQIKHWDHEADRLAATQRNGGRSRMRPENADKRARELEDRLERRLADLQAQERVVAEPPRLEATALVVPVGLLAGSRG